MKLLTHLFLMCHFCLQTSNQKRKMRINIRQINFQSATHFLVCFDIFPLTTSNAFFIVITSKWTISDRIQLYMDSLLLQFLIAIDVFVINNCYDVVIKLLLSIQYMICVLHLYITENVGNIMIQIGYQNIEFDIIAIYLMSYNLHDFHCEQFLCKIAKPNIKVLFLYFRRFKFP